MKQIKEFVDGTLLKHDDVEKYELPLEQLSEVKEGYKINFVGVISTKNYTIVSFPKKYRLNELQDKKLEMKSLISIINKFKSSKAYYKNTSLIVETIPYDSLIYIVNYYNKYGLYKVNNYKESINKNGKVLWSKTLNKYSPYISNGNLIVHTLISRNSNYKENFISDSMRWVVEDIIGNYDFIFNVNRLTPTVVRGNNKFRDDSLIIEALINEKKYIFKDIDKNLIDHLVKYYKYISSSDRTFKMFTNEFEVIWQDAVGKFLNDTFVGYDDGKFIFGNGTQVFNNDFFNVGKSEHGIHNIDVDHFLKTEKRVYIFDSKYYESISQLDYKQLCYHYFITKKYNVNVDDVINVLIAPTEEKEIMSKCHIDRKEIDGVYIHELYLPINLVMGNYVNKF